jgi:hypothetical protein
VGLTRAAQSLKASDAPTASGEPVLAGGPSGAGANEVDVMRSLSINDEVHGVMYGCVGENGGAIQLAVDLRL